MNGLMGGQLAAKMKTKWCSCWRIQAVMPKSFWLTEPEGSMLCRFNRKGTFRSNVEHPPLVGLPSARDRISISKRQMECTGYLGNLDLEGNLKAGAGWIMADQNQRQGQVASFKLVDIDAAVEGDR